MAFDPDAYIASQSKAAAPAAVADKKTGFDPDAYLAMKDGMANQSSGAPTPIEVGQFDPDQYLYNKQIEGSAANQAEFGTPEEMAKTAAEGLASGATLGFSKVAETHGIPALGIPAMTTPERMAARERANPWISGGANAIGTGALIAGTGGLGGLAEGAGAAARIGALGLEGAGIGGINQATDDWSQNKPLDAEKILASAGIGAALGLGGGTLVEGLRAGATGIPKVLNYFDKYLDEAGSGPSGSGTGAGGQGYVNKMLQAYSASGANPNSMINELADNFTDLYKASKEAAGKIYTEAGNFHLNNALEDTTVEQAKLNALQTATKVKALLTGTSEEATAAGFTAAEGEGLSGTSGKVVTKRLQELEQELNGAKNARDVHDALSGFATDLDKGKLIKFDKLPTAAQQADQDILFGMRNAVRGDLKNPEIWGKSAPVYQELSDRFANYQVARRNFEKDFMKSRIGSNGQTVKVVDPAKVGSFFKDPTMPNQSLKGQSLGNFTQEALSNAKYAEDYSGYQKGLDDLSTQIMNHVNKTGNAMQKGAAIKALADAKSGHSLGLANMAAAAFLPAPLKAPVLAMMRYSGEGGSRMLGSDMFHSIKIAKGLATHAEAATNRIAAGAKSIFRSAPKKD